MGVHIAPEKEKIRVGDEVKCSAKGNPTPDITMTPHRDSDKKGAGWKTFRVGSDLVGQNITISCAANNSVDEVDETSSLKRTLHVQGIITYAYLIS